jgi:hypothetical protein
MERKAMEFAVELLAHLEGVSFDGLQQARSHLPRRPRHAGCTQAATRRDLSAALEQTRLKRAVSAVAQIVAQKFGAGDQS